MRKICFLYLLCAGYMLCSCVERMVTGAMQDKDKQPSDYNLLITVKKNDGYNEIMNIANRNKQPVYIHFVEPGKSEFRAVCLHFQSVTKSTIDSLSNQLSKCPGVIDINFSSN